MTQITLPSKTPMFPKSFILLYRAGVCDLYGKHDVERLQVMSDLQSRLLNGQV